MTVVPSIRCASVGDTGTVVLASPADGRRAVAGARLIVAREEESDGSDGKLAQTERAGLAADVSGFNNGQVSDRRLAGRVPPCFSGEVQK